RCFAGGEAAFWDAFLAYTMVLCKTPLALHIAAQDGSWFVHHECHGDATLAGRVTVARDLNERALQNGFAFERLEGELAGFSHPFLVALKLDGIDSGDHSILLIVLDKANARQFNDFVIRIQLVTDIPASYYRNRQSLPAVAARPSEQLLASVIDVAAIVSSKDRFLLACMTLVNELAFRFDCSQVSIGWIKSSYIRTVAVSNRENFDRQSKIISDLEAVYEETLDHGAVLVWPPLNETYCVDRAHSAYCTDYNVSQIVTVPLRIHGTVVAVISLEKKTGTLEHGTIEAVKVVADQVSPWLEMLHHKSRWFGARGAVALERALDSLFSADNSLFKLATVLLLVGTLYLFFGEMEYTIEGSAALKTDSVGYLSAPFDGIISEVKVHEGDIIKKDDVLLQLDTKELVLKAAQSSADITRYTRESEKSRAHEALADMKIAQSRVDEVQAELARVQQHLGQARIKAPFAGVVVEGDKNKLLGAPVTKGDMLLKIARIDAMYLTVKVHERDIGEFREREKGRLSLLGRPDETFTITVNKIIPMAEVDQKDGNIFVLKADIDDAPQAWWRPGMSGVAKIDVGKRKVAWIISHRLIDYIRMHLWW
ncbi:MAG: efflux RND transporter periplasmic adaptor subunit, partial [Desulfuromonadaceae bacterium]